MKSSRYCKVIDLPCDHVTIYMITGWCEPRCGLPQLTWPKRKMSLGLNTWDCLSDFRRSLFNEMWNIFRKSSCLHFHDIIHRICSCGSVRFLSFAISCVTFKGNVLMCFVVFLLPALLLFPSFVIFCLSLVSFTSQCEHYPIVLQLYSKP